MEANKPVKPNTIEGKKGIADRVSPLVLPRIGRYLLAMAAIIGFQLLGPEAATITYVGLAAWALRGAGSSIQALTLAWLVTFLNPAIFPGSDHALILRWLVVGTAFGRVTLNVLMALAPTVPSPIVPLLAFVAVAAAASVVTSHILSISVFRLLTFLIGSFTVLCAFHQSGHKLAQCHDWFTALFAVVILASAPLMFHEVGSWYTGWLQGILNHSQAYGVFLAMAVAYATGRFLFDGHRSWWLLAVAVAGIVSLFESQARVGALALFGGLALAVLIQLFRHVVNPVRFRLPKVILALTPFFGMIILIFVAVGYVPGPLHDFVYKYNASDLASAFEQSRGFLIDRSIENFRENPILGIGFGIPSDPELLRIRRDPLLGVPVSVPIEKGFAPTALLEENGVVGGFAFAIFLIVLLRPAFAIESMAPLWLALTGLMVNLGEALIFSFGGMGMLVWLMLGFSRVWR
jgi:hypothetical protein